MSLCRLSLVVKEGARSPTVVSVLGSIATGHAAYLKLIHLVAIDV